MRRKIALVGCALASAALALAACKAEDPYSASFDFTATPLPPEAGAPIRLVFRATNVGLIEVYQGDASLARVVNPIPNEVAFNNYVYIARNSEPPRAVAYGLYGQVFDVTATRPDQQPPPKGLPDSGSDASTGTTTDYKDNCPLRMELDLPDGAPPSGQYCGGFSTGTVGLRMETTRSNPVNVARSEYDNANPMACAFTEKAYVVTPGKSTNVGLPAASVLVFSDSVTNQVFRRVRLTTGGNCDFIIQ